MGLSVGAHLGNRRRGNLPMVLLASTATWGAGIGLAAAAGDVGSGDEGAAWVLITLPIVQTLITVAVERATGRARYERFMVTSLPGGRWGLGTSVSF